MTFPLIQVDTLTVERDLTTILENFSWRVQPGEHWVVFGPNGAGKTTVLNVVLGYLWPTTGSVRVLGEQYGQTDLRELRARIGMVSDSVRSLMNPQLTGFEAILTGTRAHFSLFDDPSPEEMNRAWEVIEIVKIPRSLLNRPYAVLSTGERQRVLIARALMARPPLLVLDEPCAGLDLAGRELVLQTMRRAAEQEKAPSLLLCTHHVEEILPEFTHALLIKQGRVLAAGPLEEVFSSQNLSRLFDLPIELSRQAGRYAARGKVLESLLPDQTAEL